MRALQTISVPLPGITGKNLWFLEVILSSKVENNKCRRRLCNKHKKTTNEIQVPQALANKK